MSNLTSKEWNNKLKGKSAVSQLVFNTKSFMKFLVDWDEGLELDEDDSDDYRNWTVADFYEDLFEPSGDDEYDMQQMTELVADYLVSKHAKADDVRKAESLL